MDPMTDQGGQGDGAAAAGRGGGAEGGSGDVGVAGSIDDNAGGVAGSPPEELVPFCDALAVVRAKCQRCHGDPLRNGAPVPFLRYEDFQAFYFEETQTRWWQRAWEMVERGFMPYVELNEPPTSLMPPVEPLTAEEKATLMKWFEQGATPEGGTDCP